MTLRRVLAWGGLALLAYVLIGTLLHRVAFPVPPIESSLLPRAGDSVYNHLAGERLVFRRTGAETDGASFEVDLYLDPHGAVPIEHVHAEVEEYFTVVEGVLTVRVSGVEKQLRPGETIVVPPGTPHQPFNPTDQVVHVIGGGKPAGKLDLCLVQTHMLLLDRNQKQPSPITVLGIVATAPEGCDIYPAGPPVALLRALRVVVAPAARIFGFRGFEPKYSERARPRRATRQAAEAVGRGPRPFEIDTRAGTITRGRSSAARRSGAG
jgi:mannose-6-phosphate isomerase-like protein (cupin superfamily)